MPELSFLVAQTLVIAALALRAGGLGSEMLALGLAVVVPCWLGQAGLLLPRVTDTKGRYGVGTSQAVLAWVLGVGFGSLAVLAIHLAARKVILTEAWHLPVALAAAEAVYWIYAAWFVQIRVSVGQKQICELRERMAQQEFDVFLCHNSHDKEEVKEVAAQLMKAGLKPWLDVWELRPGLRWQPLIEEQVRQVKSAAVFVGADGLGPWQAEELDAFLRTCVERGIPVIPVLLPNTPSEPKLPPFLSGRTWVDFRQVEPDPLEQLVFGITGQTTSAPAKPPRSTSSKAR